MLLIVFKTVWLSCMLLIPSTRLTFGFHVENTNWSKEFTSQSINTNDLATLQSLWHDWKISFNRQYSSIDQESKRFSIWTDNLRNIISFNDNKNSSHKLRLNQFGDLTNSEFSSKYTQRINISQDDMEHDKTLPTTHVTTLFKKRMTNNPASIDWSNINGTSYVSPAQYEQYEENAYTPLVYSIVGAVECRYAIAHNEAPKVLSDRQVADCCDECSPLSGSYKYYYEYVINGNGLCTQELSHAYMCFSN